MKTLKEATVIAAKTIFKHVKREWIQDYSVSQLHLVLERDGVDHAVHAEIRSPLGVSAELRVSTDYLADDNVELTASVPGQGSLSLDKLKELADVVGVINVVIAEIQAEIGE